MNTAQLKYAGLIPAKIPNLIGGVERVTLIEDWFDKLNPHDGTHLCQAARSRGGDVEIAVLAAWNAQPGWADTTPIRRGEILHAVCDGLRSRRDEMAGVVAAETGKSLKSALGEVDAAVQLGRFFAGEGQRLFGRTMPSGTPNRTAMTIREPVGVAGLIIAANTPIANVAWKVFPALICGNAAVLKAAEDTPVTAWLFGKIATDAGLPPGILNVVHGLGKEAGAALVEHAHVPVVSFTGSTQVGRQIAALAGIRLAKVSLELGGKNPLVVCDDADIDNAVTWTLLSAFSNSGQRCAAGSRIIVFDAIYEKFRDLLVERTRNLKVGPGDDDDFGPVINGRQLENILAAIERARLDGATILTGGQRMTDAAHAGGFYLMPTLIDNVPLCAEITDRELFGPVACLYRAKDFHEALALANATPYGLTACIHTRNIHRAWQFTRKVQAGVAVVNAGTFGSEPHMPFGGVKHSGNGSREPGTEALDVYSTLKNVCVTIDPQAC